MQRIKGLKIYVFFTLVLVLGLILGPNLKWFSPTRWWGQSLVVLMNENEARPCGGFVTAYGVLNLPFGGVELKNSFAFPELNLGLSPEPLSRVSIDQKFWDLGTSPNLNICAQEVVSAYERASGSYPDRALLIQSSVVENYLTALGAITAGDLTLSGQKFFAVTSRLVADIDRHDEDALDGRKDPLNLVGKKLVISTLLRPWKWHAISQAIYEAEARGAIYQHRPGYENKFLWTENQDFTMALSEWNLGGGKSSRYLDKQWNVRLNQITKTQWELINDITVTHLGGRDEPLSQAWQGGFEFNFFNREERFVPATIVPGGRFTHSETFLVNQTQLTTFMEDLPPRYNLNLYAPPYQDWHASLQVRALAQQMVESNTDALEPKENTALWQGDISLQGEPFSFNLVPDTLAPFLTWHKPLPNPSPEITELLDLVPGDVVVELHFNEPIDILNARPATLENGWRRYLSSDLNISLTDRNYEVPYTIENLSPQSALLLTDNTTLLLKVRPQPYQTDERYYIEINDIADQWGNTRTIDNRTVITR